jgi:hypothetical protein
MTPQDFSDGLMIAAACGLFFFWLIVKGEK